MGKTAGKPTFLTPPPPLSRNPFVGYYQQRVSEARQRLRDGLYVNWDQAKEDYCALLRAKEPNIERHGPEREAPAAEAKQPELPKKTEEQLLKELGF